MGIEVKADSPYKTLKDLVNAAKASPGKLTYSTSGVFGSDHFSMEMFQKVAGIKMTHVPCTSSAAANTALLGGHVDMTNCGIGIMKPHLDSGAVRLLGVMQTQRTKLYPDIPTFTEAGYPVVFPLWYGLLAPKDVPKDVLDAIRGAAKKTVDENKAFFEENLASQGVELNYLGHEEFDKSNRAISKIMKELFQELKAK
jgi:tripartite-type tricarboxylate transporter receptor subunit TctC